MGSNLIPKDFVHLFQDAVFLRATFPGKESSIIEADGCVGRRHTLGPLCIEYYTTDTVPALSPFRGLRLVLWTPVTRSNKPSGWIGLPKNKSTMVYSFVDIRGDDYWRLWGKTFKNYRNQWERQSTFTIKEVTHKEYEGYYRTWGAPAWIVKRFEERTQQHINLDTESAHFYILENVATNEILAGVCCIDSLVTHQSYYLSSFTRKDIAPPQAGFWLCYYWIEVCRARGIWFANLGVVWVKGHPLDWKGFSDFKMKFNPILLHLPRDLLKVTFSLFKNK